MSTTVCPRCSGKTSRIGRFDRATNRRSPNGLRFDLKQQKEDLDLYLSAFQVEKRTILATWIRLAPYRNLTPTTVQEPERRLYLTDIEAILELLNSENDVEPLDPDV